MDFLLLGRAVQAPACPKNAGGISNIDKLPPLSV
jgi:hypothetical protein